MILLQIFAFFSSITVALFNEIPVRKMRDFGASIEEERNYHFANFQTLSWLNIALTYKYSGVDWLIAVSLAAFIQWMTFDIALNHFTGKPLFYVGETAKLDKLQRKYLGEHAGKIKAGACVVVIIALNVLYQVL